MPSEALIRRQAKCGASEFGSPPQPLRVIQAQGLVSLASASSPGRPGPGHQHVTPETSLSVVDRQSLIAEQKPPSASAGAGASGASASASIVSASASIVSASGASASASGVNASASQGASGASATSHGTRVPTPGRPESPLAHARRGASPNHVPPARVETFPTGTEYRLSIALPRPGGALFASEMITVSARRGGRLAVVADAWHLEHDCGSTPFFSLLHFSVSFAGNLGSFYSLIDID